MKILLIDQDPVTLEMLQTSLTRAGYTVFIAADGNAGLRLARTEQPDLIVMDILLIGLDGVQVAQALRQDDLTKSIPIFIISSLDIPKSNEPWQPTPQARWQLLRYQAYLPKPVDLNQFVRNVEAQLEPSDAPKQSIGATVFMIVKDQARLASLQMAMGEADFDVRSYTDLKTALPAIYTYLPAGAVLDESFLQDEHWQPLKRFQERNPAFSMVILQDKISDTPPQDLSCIDYMVSSPMKPWQVVLAVERSLRNRNLDTRVRTLSKQVLALNGDLLDTKSTLQYQNQELDLINRRLLELSELKETLTGMLVHDLKAPLSAIMGAMQFLTMDPKNTISENSHRILSGGLAAGQQMLRLTHTLLDEQKLENNQLVFDIEPTDIIDPINVSVEMMGPLFNMHKVTVDTTVEEDTPPVLADPIILQRIIENLLDNAIKYSPTNEVVTISVIKQGDFAEISIVDRGEGIPEDQREAIFDRFTQLTDANKKTLRGGVGLGLAFCKLAVETMGGKIWVDSPQDLGTAFRFSLPLTTPSAQTD